MANKRCWKGYEAVPGKDPYSSGSCRKKGSSSKKKTATVKRRKK